MVQSHHRLDAMLKQFIDEAIVEAETRRVDRTTARRQHRRLQEMLNGRP